MIFVLWGMHCHENVATTFVTEMRTVGLSVKVVGLGGRRLTGVHGLALVPDLTLGQALPLAQHATCIVIPCDGTTFQNFYSDPRLQEFVSLAQANDSQFVVGDGPIFEHSFTRVAEGRAIAIAPLVYPADQKLLPFARALAQSLLGN